MLGLCVNLFAPSLRGRLRLLLFRSSCDGHWVPCSAGGKPQHGCSRARPRSFPLTEAADALAYSIRRYSTKEPYVHFGGRPQAPQKKSVSFPGVMLKSIVPSSPPGQIAAPVRCRESRGRAEGKASALPQDAESPTQSCPRESARDAHGLRIADSQWFRTSKRHDGWSLAGS